MASTPLPLQSEPHPPLWSVMIPTYRPDINLLQKTLESVLHQIGAEDKFQIEVIDDCSPAMDVAGIVQGIASDRIKVSRSDTNLGMAATWNRCIERAVGKFVHILHQDDVVFTGFYATLERGFYLNPSVGAGFCRHAFIDHAGHWICISKLEAPEAGILPDTMVTVASEQCIQFPSIAVRRSAYTAVGGFRADLPHALDWKCGPGWPVSFRFSIPRKSWPGIGSIPER